MCIQLYDKSINNTKVQYWDFLGKHLVLENVAALCSKDLENKLPFCGALPVGIWDKKEKRISKKYQVFFAGVFFALFWMETTWAQKVNFIDSRFY